MSLAVLLAFAIGAVPAMASQEIIQYTRPPLADYQTDAIFHAARYGLIEASTKSGKTHGCLAWLFEKGAINGAPGRNFWWASPVCSQAEIAFRRLSIAIPAPLRRLNRSKLNITLPHDATVWFKSGEKPDNLYGEDVYAAVIDEASRFREESYHAIRTTLTRTRGPLRMIGNVKGRKNWFYKLCRKVEGMPAEKRDAYRHHRITYKDAIAAGILEAAEIEDARNDLPEHVFRELFEAMATDDEGNPFGIEAIRARVAKLSTLPAVAFGIDLAKSVDYSTIIGLDAVGQTCRFERFQLPWTETMQRIRKAVGRTRALVDSTGVGDPVLEALQRGEGRNFEGYKFTSESKQRLMEGLAVAIQRGETSYPAGPIVTELEAFEYEYTRTGVKYSAPSGMYDDCVCGLALAVSARQHSLGLPKWRPIA